MNGLLEFVFEEVSPSHLAAMVIECVREKNNVSEVVRDGVPLRLDSVLDSAYLSKIAAGDEDVACTANLKHLSVGEKLVECVTLRIIHYDDISDVSLLFSSFDCKKAGISTSEELYRWAKGFSVKYRIANFFGGLEPASDEQTQLFSKDRVGPVMELR
jgi:hypothetical protein